MISLVERMRQARESGMDLDGFRFKLIRPTIEQMVNLKAAGFAQLDLAKDYVIGWDNVREVDLVKGGSTDPAEFSREAWHEWLADHPEWWMPIGQEVLALFNRHTEAKADAAKN